MTLKQQSARNKACLVCPKMSRCEAAKNRKDPDAACPLSVPKWGAIPLLERVQTRQYGDAVAMVAQPVAQVIDALLGTELKTCGGCAQRRERMNQTEG